MRRVETKTVITCNRCGAAYNEDAKFIDCHISFRGDNVVASRTVVWDICDLCWDEIRQNFKIDPTVIYGDE